MAAPQEKLFWTVEEYLELEKKSEVRHEYVEGAIYPMAGEKKRHNRLAGRLFNRLSQHLEETDCEVYFESVKMYSAANKYYYPDVTVTCEDDEDDERLIRNPSLIIEVLSPSTERIDRAEKLIAYQKISSVDEYVLVSSERVWIQVYRRTDKENWSVEQFLGLGDEVVFKSINLTLKLADVYRNITFPATESEIKL